MYRSILKRDLKRKKTMNFIVLLFIILSTLFVSGSVNNILAVFRGLDGFFDKAGMPDYMVVTMDKGDPEKTIKALDNIEEIESYTVEDIIFLMNQNVEGGGFDNGFLSDFSKRSIEYFDEKNNKITEMKKGTVLLPIKALEKNDLKTGDTLTITIDGVSKNFEIAGTYKDAALGGGLMGITRILINNEDYEEFASLDFCKNFGGKICGVTTNDVDAVKARIAELSTVFDSPRSTFKLAYMPDMIIAALVLVVSILLIITAFIIMRFTIGYTISEEYREIGVMKAIGIKNSKIRMIYIIKYIAIAVCGAFIGFFGSIPLSNILLMSVTKNIVLENENSFLINIICSAAIIFMIFLFSYSCTRKVRKLTPLDAIRSGQTGERFRKKSVIHMGNSRLSPKSFLAVNDVFSSPKRYSIIAVIVFLCMAPIYLCANSANTLKSDKLLPAFGCVDFDVFINDDVDATAYFSDNGEEALIADMKKTEQKLDELGMPASIYSEAVMKFNIEHGDKHYSTMMLKGINTTADMYYYDKGTAPQNENEIALTNFVCDALDVKVGDTVTISMNEGKKEFIVAATFDSMNNTGQCGRFHESCEFSFVQLSGYIRNLVKFNDSPDKKEIADRIEKLRDIYGEENVMSSGEFVKEQTGMGNTVDAVKYMALILAMIISALVAILMERSFIAKERGELAMMKAIGFKSGVIISRHTIRMAITAAVGIIAAAITSTPLTQLCVNPIFKLMGAGKVDYTIDPIENFVIYPIIIFAVIVIFTRAAALSIKKINTSEVSGIE